MRNRVRLYDTFGNILKINMTLSKLSWKAYIKFTKSLSEHA